MTITFTKNNADFCYKKFKEYFFETFKDNKFDYTSGTTGKATTLAEACMIDDVKLDKSDSNTISIYCISDDKEFDIPIEEGTKIFFNAKKLNLANGSNKFSLIRDTKSESHKWYGNSISEIGKVTTEKDLI